MALQIVILGSRGSGKTTVGKLVAAQQGIEFVDVDDLIVARSGKSSDFTITATTFSPTTKGLGASGSCVVTVALSPLEVPAYAA